MSSCIFAAPGRQEACLSLQRTREEQKLDPNDCLSCPKRAERLKAALPPQRIAVPPGDFYGKTAEPVDAKKPPRPEPVAAPPTEETSVIYDKARERVLSRILREKACKKTRLMNYCGVAKGELEEIVAELAAAGKIKAWPKGRGAVYTPPDAEDPTGCPIPAATDSNGKKPAATAKPATASGAKAPPSNGSSPFAAVIADLQAKRDVALQQVAAIDQAIEGLRALA